jgi:hypothetical protein
MFSFSNITEDFSTRFRLLSRIIEVSTACCPNELSLILRSSGKTGDTMPHRVPRFPDVVVVPALFLSFPRKRESMFFADERFGQQTAKTSAMDKSPSLSGQSTNQEMPDGKSSESCLDRARDTKGD